MSKTTTTSGRRRFLKTAALAGGAATVAAASGSALAEVDAAPTSESPQPAKSKGYQVTPHVETYYRLARD